MIHIHLEIKESDKVVENRWTIREIVGEKLRGAKSRFSTSSFSNALFKPIQTKSVTRKKLFQLEIYAGDDGRRKRSAAICDFNLLPMEKFIAH